MLGKRVSPLLGRKISAEETEKRKIARKVFFDARRSDDGDDTPGTPRCARINAQGARCTRSITFGSKYCPLHAMYLYDGAQLTMAQRRYIFKSPALQAAFERHVTDPDAYELDEELALVRTCLESVVRRVKLDTDAIEALTPESIALLTHMSTQVADTVANIAKIKGFFSNVITIEQFTLLVNLFSELMLKYCPAEQQQVMLDELSALPWPGRKGLGKNEGRRWALTASSAIGEGSLPALEADHRHHVEVSTAAVGRWREKQAALKLVRDVAERDGDDGSFGPQAAPAEPMPESAERQVAAVEQAAAAEKAAQEVPA